MGEAAVWALRKKDNARLVQGRCEMGNSGIHSHQIIQVRQQSAGLPEVV